MASGDKNFTLGLKGVVLDKAPTHADPSELLKAQNATRDPLGIDGGLKLRPALGKFNGSAAAGSVLGGISVPVFNYTDSRTIYVGQIDTTNKWFSSSNLYATSAAASAIAAWQSASTYYSLAANVTRIGVFFNGQLYYAASGYTPGTTSPTIRVFNGTDDRELCKVLPATTLGITGMFASKGYMYVLTLDSGTTDADFVGRCFRLSQNGHLDLIGTAFATGYVPQVLAVYNDSIYVGCNRLTTTNEARVYRINPTTESAWTLDATMDADDYQVTGLASFQGLLYATTKNGGAATKGKIKKRSITGTWSTVDSTVNNTGTYEDIAVFGDYLYASSRSYDAAGNTAVIRRSSDGTTWATVYNSASTAGVGWLQVIGLRLFSYFGSTVLHTTSGTAYTSATPAGAGNVSAPLGILLASGAAEWEEPVDATSSSSSTSTSGSVVSVTQGLSSFETFDDRKHGYHYAISGTTFDSFAMGTISATGATTDSNTQANSAYVRMQSSGVANSNMGVLCTAALPARLSFLPRARFRVGTWSVNQAEYIFWVGLFAQTAMSDVDTLTAEGIAFRYHHPVGSSADSGNWYLCVHDGAAQVDTDTLAPVIGGTVAGVNEYDMTLEVTSLTTCAWTIKNRTTGVNYSGTVAISAAFSSSARMGIGVWGTDVNGAVKVILYSKSILWTY